MITQAQLENKLNFLASIDEAGVEDNNQEIGIWIEEYGKFYGGTMWIANFINEYGTLKGYLK